MFEVGSCIYYATSGLCRVEEITSLDISGADAGRLYYRLVPMDGRGGTIYTPVDNKKVPMRRAMNSQEAGQLIDAMPEIGLLEIPSERLREQTYKEALLSPDCKSWVKMIKTLYKRRKDRYAQGKKDTAIEERYFRSAVERLNSELACALNLDKAVVEQYILERIGSRE